MKRVAHVCSGHSDTLTDLLRDCDALEDTKLWLDGSRDNLIADVNAAADATHEEVAALQDRAANLRSGYRTLVLDHEALQRKVRENEDLMRTAFTGAGTLGKILAPRRWRRPARVRGDGEARCAGVGSLADRGRGVVERADRRREGGGDRHLPGRHRQRRRPAGRPA